jgi:RNA polymerase sigma factor (sigma-70 family)
MTLLVEPVPHLSLSNPAPRSADGEVVRAVLAGDRERYAELVERYRDRYARYAARMLGSADAAEDAVQDAFVRAYDQLEQCKEPENFVGWFFLILRNRCFAEQRRSRGRAPLEAAGDIPARDRSDNGAETAERRRALEHALLELTPEQREVFVLKHVEGLSYGEIAERLSTSVPSLKMRMHRAYDRLRDQLRGQA